MWTYRGVPPLLQKHFPLLGGCPLKVVPHILRPCSSPRRRGPLHFHGLLRPDVVSNGQRHHTVVMGTRLRRRSLLLVPHKRQHLQQSVLVVDGLQMLPHHPDQFRDDDRPRQPVRSESVCVADGPVESVLDLPDVQVPVAHQVQQFHRVRGEVGLRRQHGVVVPLAKAVHLPGEGVLVVLVPQHGHLLSGHVVQHLSHKPVTAVSRGVRADDVGPPRRRLLVDLHRALRIVLPPDVPDVDAILRCVVGEGSGFGIRVRRSLTAFPSNTVLPVTPHWPRQ